MPNCHELVTFSRNWHAKNLPSGETSGFRDDRLNTWVGSPPSIETFQIAGVPGRNEPDQRQEINYPYLFQRIDELGYDGWIGCEYRPRAGTRAGLAWAAPFGIKASAA